MNTLIRIITAAACLAVMQRGLAAPVPAAVHDSVPAEPMAMVDLGPKVTNPVSHFAWGIDIGAAIDMTSNDMTFFDIHGYVGYRNPWLRFAGVGAGIDMMLSNSSRSYPVYAMFRTSFSSRPRLSFLDLRAGCAFNSIDTYKQQTDFYGSLGWGVTLASSRTFTSHIILSYTFMPLSDVMTDSGVRHMPDLHFASIRIGASF